jgi:2',3'-cyclic-nucleotide 2'-phosphodiesterase
MSDIKLLFCGDVVGRAGREAVVKHVPRLRKEHALDFVVVSGDNAARGFGITPEICREFYECGVDVVTGGDHVWDQKETHPYLDREPRLLRPHNFPEKTVGKGFGMYPLPDGRKIAVLHLLGQVFHKEYLDCPFACAEKALTHARMGHQVAAILVDMHAEATSEKCAMGVFLDGRVSAVVGSHTHIPTADARILPKGTAYQTDVGMCGDYNSVIGFDAEAPLLMFTTKVRKMRMQPAAGEGTLAATLITVNGETGLARSITPLLLDGVIGQ